jgi:16S rRNA (cytosine967-C5)-methyltransferase
MAVVTKNARAAIAKNLIPVIWGDTFLDRVLEAGGLEPEILTPQTREIIYGCVRWAIQLNAIADFLLEKPLKQKDRDVQVLLLIGLYQLMHMRIPPHAAVNETVNASAGLGKPWAKNLLNACLRRFQRERESLLVSLDQTPAFQYSHPAWLLSRIRQAWPERWQQIVNANNRRPTLGLRVNRLSITRPDYLKNLETAGIQAGPIVATDSGLQLEAPQRVQDLPGFETGQVSIQNGAAQLAAPWLDLRAGQTVLDACAAPGGKLAHILETEPALKTVVAVESIPNRVALTKQTLERLGLDADIRKGDASRPAEWSAEKQIYDRILLDAPCSGTGVIRRHPDIKLHRTEAQVKQMTVLQARLLEALWPLLGKGGKLLYVTCSVLPDENEKQMATFVQQHDDARPERLVLNDPDESIRSVQQSVGLQILPGEHPMDGFYYACIQKI